MKPHLRFRDGLWECTSIYERGTGFGASIRAAYYAWRDLSLAGPIPATA